MSATDPSTPTHGSRWLWAVIAVVAIAAVAVVAYLLLYNGGGSDGGGGGAGGGYALVGVSGEAVRRVIRRVKPDG